MFKIGQNVCGVASSGVFRDVVTGVNPLTFDNHLNVDPDLLLIATPEALKLCEAIVELHKQIRFEDERRDLTVTLFTSMISATIESLDQPWPQVGNGVIYVDHGRHVLGIVKSVDGDTVSVLINGDTETFPRNRLIPDGEAGRAIARGIRKVREKSDAIFADLKEEDERLFNSFNELKAAQVAVYVEGAARSAMQKGPQ